MNKFKIGDEVVLEDNLIITGWIVNEVRVESIDGEVSISYGLRHPEFKDKEGVAEYEMMFFSDYLEGIKNMFSVGDVVYFSPDSDECSFKNTPYVVYSTLGDGDVILEGNEWITKERNLIHESEYKDNNKPERYSSRLVNGMDVIDLAEHWNLNPQEMNILKYLLRDKGQDYDDMMKIVDYAQREAKLIKEREDKKTAPFGGWL